MTLTLGFTGMDSATETALAAAFEQANARVGNSWQLLPEAEAAHIVVDMDSMYGPMSWIRLHGAGKRVVGLSSASRTQTDFQLLRPFDANTLAALLREMAADAGVGTAQAQVPASAPRPKPVASPPPPAPPPVLAAHDTGPDAKAAGMANAPAPTDQLPEEQVRPVDEETAPPEPPAQARPAPPAPARDPVFTDWLLPDALAGRHRYHRTGGPVLLIDATTRQYHGPALLKPLRGYFDGDVKAKDFEPIDAATWARESAAQGAPQPLSRLQWYGALLSGKGALLPGLEPDGRYRLSKWPQTEREFPKHFRIATAMMKGPATLDEVAAVSGVPFADIADFVNASLVTGYAEVVPEPPPEPAEPPKPAGLFGRLRGR